MIGSPCIACAVPMDNVAANAAAARYRFIVNPLWCVFMSARLPGNSFRYARAAILF